MYYIEFETLCTKALKFRFTHLIRSLILAIDSLVRCIHCSYLFREFIEAFIFKINAFVTRYEDIAATLY